MADVYKKAQNETFTLANGDRFILGDGDVGRASILVFEIDLNGGTTTVVPQVRVRGETTWAPAQAFPVSAPTTGSASLTATDVYRLDVTGCEAALNCTAATGSPQVTYCFLIG